MKHLSNFYTYKGNQPDPPTEHPSIIQLVQWHLNNGHRLFFQGHYQNALQQYQTAYALVFNLLHPAFPVKIIAAQASIVRDLDVSDALLAVSAESASFSQAAGNAIPIPAPVDPPAAVVEIVEKFGAVGTTQPPNPEQNFYRLGVNYLRMGAVSQAQRFLKRAVEANDGKDPRLEADVNTAIGVSLMTQRNLTPARQAFERAQMAYSELRLDSEQAVVNNNLGILHTVGANHRSAAAAFRAAGDHLPLDLGRTMTQPIDSDQISAIVRPAGSQSLSFILRSVDSESGWITVPSNVTSVAGAQQIGVLVDDQVINVDLKMDPVVELKQKIYEPRVTADTLKALSTNAYYADSSVLFTVHVYGFTLPLSIGDCYFEMGEYDQALPWYDKVLDYPFLNQPIEAPLVWLKMANAYLHWGHFLSENQDQEEARARYERIVRLSDPILDPESSLYVSPVFDEVKSQVAAILDAPEPLDIDAHNPAIAEVVFLARLNLKRVEFGIDLPLLSLEREQVPVFTFEYLQNIARYFAEHAIQAERTYIHFKTSAEQEEFTRAMLENAVDLERANEILEAKKVEIANEQREVMDANLALADLQVENAKEHKTDFESVSLQEIAVDEDIAYISAPIMEYDFSGYEKYGISDGTHRVDEVLRTLTGRRREISREFELNNLDRRIAELNAARTVAQEQQNVAETQIELAELQRNIASIRRQQAEQQLALFDSQEFTPDLWNRLANSIKAISKTYLQQAIVIARLMEQAYEFELGRSLDIIKPSYTRNDISGLLSGDFLLQDVDSFTFWRVVLGQKKQPLKEVISLADRYPVQFLREFLRTGRINFRTELTDFDRNFPGCYQRRIKGVEVTVEGLIGRGGIHGTLTNAGLCLTRLRNGNLKMRLLKPETLLLSQYRIGSDSVVFRPDAERLAIFENSPVSTSWILELRPSVNDLIYKFITDVKLTVYYEAFHDLNLRQLVLEELAEAEPNSARRTVALRYELFDEFFSFQDTGEVRFTLRETMLPFYHTNPTVRDMTILVRTDEDVSSADLVMQISAADGTEATQTTDTDGALSTGSGALLDAFIGRVWSQEWTIALPRVLNQTRFDAGFQWSQVRNIMMVAEYEFTPRRISGEPQLLLHDRFDQDTLATFDVVDDPNALSSTPSNWSYDATNERFVQSTNIHGPAGGANLNTGPSKPGTYLVRRTDEPLPALQDLILICHLGSDDNDGIGLVFRWQDVDNFYFFLMDRQRGYRRLGKKVEGVFQELTTPAVDTNQGYEIGETYAVKVRAKGQSLRLYLDGDLIVDGRDDSLLSAGQIGFYAWGNSGARFHNLRVIAI